MSQQMQLHFGEVGERKRKGNTPTGLAFFVSKANTEKKRENFVYRSERNEANAALA